MLFQRARKRRGATIVLMAFLMIVLVGMVAFAIEVGRMYLLRSQMQKAVDSGALAASLKLKEDPTDTAAAAASAEQFVQANRVGWLVEVPEGAITVEVGEWDEATKSFSLGGTNLSAVRVSARVDNEPFMFARVLGQTVFGAPATATAAGSAGPLDVMLVLDLSGSMDSEGRVQALRNSAPAFVDIIEQIGGDDHIGVMAFGVEADSYDPIAQGATGTLYTSAPASLYPTDSSWVGVLEADLTSGFAGLKSNALASGNLITSKYGGWTPTGAAIRDAVHYLKNDPSARDGVKKAIVLMSDGNANQPSGDGPGYALLMAAYANDESIKIYTISLGNGADIDLMQSIAAATGGTHFDATGSGESSLTSNLTEAFTNAALAIKRTALVE